MSETRLAFRTCPLCEAGCGLEIAVQTSPLQVINKTESIGRIRGDMDDVFHTGLSVQKVQHSSNFMKIQIVYANH